MDVRYPFYFFIGVTLVATLLGAALIAVGRRMPGSQASREGAPATS
jgi:hypothetical protein